MPITARVSGDNEDIDPRANVGGAWKNVSHGYAKVSGVWELIYNRFSVSVSPTSASAAGAGPGTFTTNTVAVTAIGTGPFTYNWVRSSGDSRVTATASTSATTAFRATISVEIATAEFTCFVTDTSTGDVLTVIVTVTIDGTAI